MRTGPRGREERLGRWEAWGTQKHQITRGRSLQSGTARLQPVTGHLRQRFNVNWTRTWEVDDEDKGMRPATVAW